MLTHASSSDGSGSLCEIRERFKDQLNQLSLARQLWRYFLALMTRVILKMNALSENDVGRLLRTMNLEFERLFEKSLQLDLKTMRLEHRSAPLPE